MCRVAWLMAVVVSLAFFPLAARGEACCDKDAPEEALEAGAQEGGDDSSKPYEVDVEETVRVLREFAGKAREEGDVERAERAEARARAIEEGRVKPPVRIKKRMGQHEMKAGGKKGKTESEWLERIKEYRERVAQERRKFVETIDRQNEEIESLRRKTERLEKEIEAIKALLKRLAAE